MYSVSETSYIVTKANGDGEEIINQWSDKEGLKVGDYAYAPSFPHDAGDAYDEMNLDLDDEAFYHIIV